MDIKESMLSTFESRRVTEAGYTRSMSYNINDYLPNEIDIKPIHIVYSRKEENEFGQKSKLEVSENEFESTYMETIMGLQDTLKEKEVQIERINEENQNKQKCLENIISELRAELEKYFSLTAKLTEECSSNASKLKEMEKMLETKESESKLVNSELIEVKRNMEKKKSNVRLFYQKYELNIPPKIKQLYTIEVQTEKEELKIQSKEQLPQEIQFYKPQNETFSHRKVSCHSKPQFFELYQQQKNEMGELFAHPTSRSQVIASGYKPKKPAFIENMSDLRDKENDRKRINERIDNKLNENKEKEKIKVKKEEIEICPIDEDQLDDVVRGILNRQQRTF